MTSIDMAGLSLTMIKLEDDQWLKNLNEEVKPFLGDKEKMLTVNTTIEWLGKFNEKYKKIKLI